jgi:hypothetical protein
MALSEWDQFERAPRSDRCLRESARKIYFYESRRVTNLSVDISKWVRIWSIVSINVLERELYFTDLRREFITCERYLEIKGAGRVIGVPNLLPLWYQDFIDTRFKCEPTQCGAKIAGSGL